jgi:hypothetical protein
VGLGVRLVPPILYFPHSHDADGVEQDRQRDERHGQRHVARLHDVLPMRLGQEVAAKCPRSFPFTAAKRVISKAFLKVDGAARNTNEI